MPILKAFQDPDDENLYLRAHCNQYGRCYIEVGDIFNKIGTSSYVTIDLEDMEEVISELQSIKDEMVEYKKLNG